MRRTAAAVLTVIVIVGCASGPQTHKRVNEIDPNAYWQHDYYACKNEAEKAEELPAANIAGSVALALNIVKHRDECMAARGWRLVPIGESQSPPAAVSVPLTIHSAPDAAEVYVDGKFIGSTPLRDFRVTPGVHVIEVHRRGFAGWRRELTIQAGTPVAVQADLERTD